MDTENGKISGILNQKVRALVAQNPRKRNRDPDSRGTRGAACVVLRVPSRDTSCFTSRFTSRPSRPCPLIGHTHLVCTGHTHYMMVIEDSPYAGHTRHALLSAAHTHHMLVTLTM